MTDTLEGSTEFRNKDIRRLALTLLDNENGLRKQDFNLLRMFIIKSDNDDILSEVDTTNGQTYIGEDYAEEELRKINESD